LNNFITRTLTGAGIVIFILGGFWLHPVSFILTGLILLTGALYEYYSLIGKTGIKPRSLEGITGGVLLYLLSSLSAAGFIHLKYLLLLFPVFTLLMAAQLYRSDERPFDTLAQTFFPLLYIAAPFSMFPFAAFDHSGLEPLLGRGNMVFSPGLIIGFFLLIWANDTGAYLAGITLGRHKLMPSVSPKKTWEGLAGGILLALVVSRLLPGWLGVTGSTGWMITALIISVAGTYGDLAESMLKRSTGVKDSGSILPGHGGFLDRFDSTILSFPLVYLFVALFG
jgi:phosphatidate cytidylyltransferase